MCICVCIDNAGKGSHNDCADADSVHLCGRGVGLTFRHAGARHGSGTQLHGHTGNDNLKATFF